VDTINGTYLFYQTTLALSLSKNSHLLQQRTDIQANSIV
jgi:hypothetical protein